MEIRVTAAAPFPLNNLSAANLDIRILDGGINEEDAPGQKPTLRENGLPELEDGDTFVISYTKERRSQIDRM